MTIVVFDPRTYASAHLRWSELACHDLIGTPYPLDWRESRGRALGAAFEVVRQHVGAALEVLSGYRTPAYNASIRGAASNSYHAQGMALDLACPRGLTWEEFVSAVRQAVADPASGIRGFGAYPSRGFVHIDIRPGDRLVTWTA